MLQQVEVEIGGQIIDRQYGEWLYLWETLTADFDTAMKLDNMVGGQYSNGDTAAIDCQGRPRVIYVPFQFWFNRNPGLALPLIALQYHEVRFNITLNDAINLAAYNVTGTTTPVGTLSKAGSLAAAANALPQPKDMALYIDYIYLDVEERRRFAQESHEYLIEQLQFEGQQQITSASDRIDLTLNHPVKELIWVFQDARKTDCSLPETISDSQANYTQEPYTQPFSYNDVINRCRLQINGQDRFEERYGDYFWKVQPYQHHTGGGYPRAFASAGSVVVARPAPNPINVYSFAIAPEEHQPSGTCNFSRIDNATLVFDSFRPVITAGNPTDIGNFPSKAYPYNFRLYAVNYNILRIMSGMGGLAYSN
jgi:hypothetical protein